MQRSIYVLPPRPGVVEEPKTNEEVNALEEKLRDEAHDAFNHYTPQFRLPTPDTPESFLETWVSAKYVSPKSDENILKFQIFFAMDATKDLGRGSNKVVMTVETEQLPLKPHERRRLVRPGPWTTDGTCETEAAGTKWHIRDLGYFTRGRV
eukprot:6176109-Pleurochrysis_carterae.AAC.2